MDIHVVQPDETIDSIADLYGISVEKLIQDNVLDNPNELVPGQTIVIVYPRQTHTVQEGDTLDSIADAYGVSLMQLLRNNPYLTGREYIYPGETLVISYNTTRKITTNGYTYPYIKRETLLKALPGLTYLTVFNYRATGEGEIIAYYDDEEIIQTAKAYGTAPIMMVSTLSIRGEPDIEVAFNLLLNEAYQDRHNNDILQILKTKGYYGVNITFNYINANNQYLYENFITRISKRVRSEGYLLFVTVNTRIQNIDNEITFEKVDFTNISKVVDKLIIMQFVWGTNVGPPAPVSNINNLRAYIDYVVTMVPPEKMIIGKPLIGHSWELPYDPSTSDSFALTIDTAIKVAKDAGVVIQFDELSQTPYFIYNRINFGAPAQYIVWFLDARSMGALYKLINDYNLNGTAIWNIMVYYPQMWLLINSQYEVEKVLTDTTII